MYTYNPTNRNSHTIQKTALVVQSVKVAGVIPAIIPDNIIKNVKEIMTGKNNKIKSLKSFFIVVWVHVYMLFYWFLNS